MTSAACTTVRQADRLAELERALAAHDSATIALESWCERHAIAEPPEVTALPVAGAPITVPDEAKTLLALDHGESIAIRHVELVCGDTVLSRARNFYVPQRLPTEMNVLLDTTTMPFGRVVASLGYRRERLEAVRGAAGGCAPDTVLSHRALLRLPDGRPLSLLAECYTPEALAAARRR